MCLLNFVCITQTQHALWKYRESPILLRILLQPFLGLGNQAIVGRIVLQLFANGVAVGMVENHTRKLRPAGLQRRFRPTPGGAGEWAEQQIGKRVKPSVHGYHSRVYHARVGAIYTHSPRNLVGKLHGIVRKREFAAPVSAKL